MHNGNLGRVLVADDDRGLLEALRIRLQAEGFEVITTADAYQALALTHRENPDVLLLDINMPAGSGFSVRERLMISAPQRTLPIVYMTGSSNADLDREAEKLGGHALLRKPFDTTELASSLLDAIEMNRLGAV
jgi:DNA-binding response OmpR family regulator